MNAAATGMRLVLLVIISANFKSYCTFDSEYQSADLTNDGNTVLLGGLFPVHSGPDCNKLEDDHVQLVESMAHTVDLINRNSSLLPGIRLVFTIKDSCSSSPKALTEAFDFVQRATSLSCNSSNSSGSAGGTDLSVSGVVGAHYSRVSIDLANLLRLYQIPQISYISTADVLGDKSRFDYFFRTVPPDSLQSRALADIIIQFNWTYIFALYSDDDYGNGGIDALLKHLEAHNKTDICIASKIPLSVKPHSSEYDNALKLMSREYYRNASVAVLFGHLQAAEGMMEAIERAFKIGEDTFYKKLLWLGTDSWGDSLPAKYHHIPGGVLSVIPRAAKYRTFDQYFTSLRPENHSNCWFQELWGCNASNECTPRNSSSYVYKQASHLTLVSDAVMAFAHAIHGLVSERCPNLTLCDEILERRSTGVSVNGSLLRDQLFNISFVGYSENRITFNRDGEEKGVFDIKNLKRSDTTPNTFETIGIWDNELLLMQDIDWPTGSAPESVCSTNCSVGNQRNYIAETRCCWSCSLCLSENSISDGNSQCRPCEKGTMPDKQKGKCIPIPIAYLQVSNAWSILFLILTSIGLLTTLVTIAVFLICHNHKVIKASSREVSIVLLLGLVLCYISPAFFLIKPSAAICASRRFIVGFSFAVSFSSLLIKTNRIYRIFNQKNLDPTKPPRFTSPKAQVLMTFGLVCIQGLAAAVWLAVEHPSTVIIYGLNTATLKCSESEVSYIAISLGYNFILLVLSTYNAFLARKVPENFNEARYINITLYSLCIIWLASITTYFATLKLGPTFQAGSLMAAIILSAATILGCIFVPKVILLLSMCKKKEKKSQTFWSFTQKEVTTKHTEANDVQLNKVRL